MKTRFAVIVAIAMAAAGVGAIAPFSWPALSQSLDQAAEASQRQLDPTLPIRIEVVNAGNTAITCVLTQPASAERQLAPGARTSFGTVTTSYLPLPINFLAYASNTQIGLSSDLTIEGNVVTIVISEQRSETPGDIAMNIDPDGYIYFY
jgi:hypothetical protein